MGGSRRLAPEESEAATRLPRRYCTSLEPLPDVSALIFSGACLRQLSQRELTVALTASPRVIWGAWNDTDQEAKHAAARDRARRSRSQRRRQHEVRGQSFPSWRRRGWPGVGEWRNSKYNGFS